MKETGLDLLRFPNRMAPGVGTLLVANPFLPDNNFRRTVVLITEHNDDGTVGFVINKPVELRISEVVNDFPDVDCSLAYGGPVQLDTLHFLHCRPDLFDPCTPVTSDGVCWGGDFATLRVGLDTATLLPDEVRFFVGYAGWAPAQLADEIANESWIVAPASRAVVFQQSPEQLWRSVLRQMGGHFAHIANFPEDPRMN
jgi:putative transcriptional regulator